MDQIDIHKLLEAAISADLMDQRSALLAGIDPKAVATLPRESRPDVQILSDLTRLRDASRRTTGSAPLVLWLRNAVLLAELREQVSVFREALDHLLSAPDPTGDEQPRTGGPARPEAPRAKVFVSYRREGDEAVLARRVRDAMTAAGHTVLIDIGLAVGVDWALQIRQNIQESDFFIVLLSAESMAREMILAEVREAHRHARRTGKPHILPVRVLYDGPLDYELEHYLGKLHYAKWSGPEDNQRVVERLLAAVEGDDYTDDSQRPAQGLNRPPTIDPPAPSVDPRALSADLRFMAEAAGTMPPDDTFYVRRACDDEIEGVARSGQRHTVVIRGPRQRGKSSLLMRYIALAAKRKRVAFVDFQQFSGTELSSYTEFLTALAVELLAKMGIDAPTPAINRTAQMTIFLQGTILAAARGKLALVIDEADRLIGQAYQSDFFALLRSWQNNGANPAMPAWRELDIALVISTEPFLLIKEEHQSPFNHAQNVRVDSFTLEECTTLAKLYPDVVALPDADAVIEDLHVLLGGHPYLTRLAFHRIAVNKIAPEVLHRSASEEHGPFGDHLRAIVTRLSKDPDLLPALLDIIHAGKVTSEPDPTKGEVLAHRLQSAGLIVGQRGKYAPANLLYARFFKSLG